MQKAIIPCIVGTNSAKELAVKILGEEWPLSVKQLCLKIEKAGSKRFSYQAVHKALKELSGAGIVKQAGTEYSINTDWLDRVESYAKKMLKNYEKQGGDEIVESGSHVFKTIHECEEFLVEFLFIEGAKEKTKSPIVCTHWNHFWVPLFLNKETYQILKEAAPLVDVYSVTNSNTWLDRWCHEFWKKHFVRTRIGVKDSTNPIEIAVINDNVLQIFQPEHLRKQIDDFYDKTKEFNQLDLTEFFESTFEQKTKIPVTITKNTVLAEQIRKETMSWF